MVGAMPLKGEWILVVGSFHAAYFDCAETNGYGVLDDPSLNERVRDSRKTQWAVDARDGPLGLDSLFETVVGYNEACQTLTMADGS